MTRHSRTRHECATGPRFSLSTTEQKESGRKELGFGIVGGIRIRLAEKAHQFHVVKVIALITFEFTRAGHEKLGSARFAKTIQMPAAPVGIDVMIVTAGTVAANAEVSRVAWSEPRDAYVVTGVAAVDEYYLNKLKSDSAWEFVD